MILECFFNILEQVPHFDFLGYDISNEHGNKNNIQTVV